MPTPVGGAVVRVGGFQALRARFLTFFRLRV
jgi:hypothetical protein